MKYFLIVTLLFLTCSSNSLKWNTKQLLQKQKTIYIKPLSLYVIDIIYKGNNKEVQKLFDWYLKK